MQLEWTNRRVNMWTRETAYLSLVTNQGQYILPNSVNDIIQANLRTSTRQLNGTPAASSGNAANAFDGNPATSCIQTAADGNISYDYGAGVTQQINFIGIQSNANETYTLRFDFSQDNNTWVPLFNIPAQTYTTGITSWFDVPAPLDARAYRIVETGGKTLNIQELYFNNNVYDMPLSNISRDEYITLPYKQQQGRPSIYYLDRQLGEPTLNIWQTPSGDYNCIQYSYQRMMQDVGSLYTNTVDIPSQFYPPLIWGLSWRLAIKFKPELADRFKAQYEESLKYASDDNSESVPLNIYPDYSGREYY
jgi:hypothetical protein